MREPSTDSVVAYAVALLNHYKFELRGYTANELVNLWLRKYPVNWVRMAVIEALYQGRYKAVSVEQFLAVWARRGQPIYRFTHEFERLISRKLPQSLTAPLDALSTDPIQELSLPPVTPSTPDTTDENEMLEQSIEDEAPIAEQESLPSATMPTEELTELPVELDDPLPEVVKNGGFSPTYDADWSRCEVSKRPIHQFTPPPDFSGFYLKLKAVAQHQEPPPTNGTTPVIDEDEAEKPPSPADKL